MGGAEPSDEAFATDLVFLRLLPELEKRDLGRHSVRDSHEWRPVLVRVLPECAGRPSLIFPSRIPMVRVTLVRILKWDNLIV